MNIIAIIPARLESSRLSNKPLIKINNKPLIQLTYEAALNTHLFSAIYIATNSKKIKNTVESFGAKCIMSSTQHNNGTERCIELVKKMCNQIANDDLIVNIQCDEPFLRKKHLQKIINLFYEETKIGTLISNIETSDLADKSVVKVAITNEYIATKFSRIQSQFKKEQKLYKHIGVYAYKKFTLLQLDKLDVVNNEQIESLEQIRWLENGYPIKCCEINENLISINTESDLKKIEKK